MHVSELECTRSQSRSDHLLLRFIQGRWKNYGKLNHQIASGTRLFRNLQLVLLCCKASEYCVLRLKIVNRRTELRGLTGMPLPLMVCL